MSDGSPKTPQRRLPKPGRAKPPELRARAFELRAAGKTERQIAQALNLHRSTVSRWLREPEAAAEVKALSSDTRASAVEKLKAGAEAAVDALIEVITDPEADPHARVSASKTLLSRVGIVEGAALDLTTGAGEDPLARIQRLLGDPPR